MLYFQVKRRETGTDEGRDHITSSTCYLEFLTDSRWQNRTDANLMLAFVGASCIWLRLRSESSSELRQ